MKIQVLPHTKIEKFYEIHVAGHDNPAPLEEFILRLGNPNCHVLAAVDRDVVEAGCMYVLGDESLDVVTIDVNPNLYRTGIGSKVLKAVLKRVRKPIRFAHAMVGANDFPVAAFFRRNGFRAAALHTENDTYRYQWRPTDRTEQRARLNLKHRFSLVN